MLANNLQMCYNFLADGTVAVSAAVTADNATNQEIDRGAR
jgi:hypothetical protein